jgi:tetratricopeptide (TPR) repeat protein
MATSGIHIVATLVLLTASALGQSQPGSEAGLKETIAKHQAGDYAGAIEGYQRFLKAHPEVAAVRSNLGAALAHEGRYDEAVHEYTLALETDPKNGGVRLNLGLAYYKSGRIAEAAEAFSKVHVADPANLQATLLLANTYLYAGENKKVIELLEPLVTAGQAEDSIFYLYGSALIRDHQFERGQVWLDTILRKTDSAEAHLLMGTARMLANDLVGAQADLRRAVEINPNLAEAHTYLGESLRRSGDTPGAVTEFRRSLAIDPYIFDSCLMLGELLRQDQEYAEARTYLERALKIRSGDFGARYQLATVDLGENKLEPARTVLESLVQEAPQFVEAHVSLATLYYRLKRKEDGDREREIVKTLQAAEQAKQVGAKSERNP